MIQKLQCTTKRKKKKPGFRLFLLHGQDWMTRLDETEKTRTANDDDKKGIHVFCIEEKSKAEFLFHLFQRKKHINF